MNNTGQPNCVKIPKAIKAIIIAPYFDNAGVVNSISIAGSTVAGSAITALINQADISKRWFPLPLLKNIDTTRADSDMKKWDDNTSQFLNVGIRSFKMTMPNQGFVMLNKLSYGNCSDIGLWLIDYDNNLIGMQGATGLMYGMRVSKGSWDTAMLFALQTKEVTSINIKLDLEPSEYDENMVMVLASEITSLNISLTLGLVDVNADISAISTTGFTLTLTGDYGSTMNKNKLTGFVNADFALYNNTDQAAIIITSVTETAVLGVYTVVIPAQTSADSITISGSKTGYDMSRIDDTPFLIP